LSWTFLNGSDSREFRVSFQKDFPVSFYDERQIPSITPTPTPTVPEFSWLTILPLLASILLVSVATKRFKH